MFSSKDLLEKNDKIVQRKNPKLTGFGLHNQLGSSNDIKKVNSNRNIDNSLDIKKVNSNRDIDLSEN